MTIRALSSIEKGALIPTDQLKAVDDSIKPQLLNALDEITWFPYNGIEMCVANEIVRLRNASSTHFRNYISREFTASHIETGLESLGIYKIEGAEIINVLRKELALSITYVDNLIKPRTSTLYLLNFDAFYEYAIYGNDDFSILWKNLSKRSINFTAKEGIQDVINNNPNISKDRTETIVSESNDSNLTAMQRMKLEREKTDIALKKINSFYDVLDEFDSNLTHTKEEVVEIKTIMNSKQVDLTAYKSKLKEGLVANVLTPIATLKEKAAEQDIINERYFTKIQQLEEELKSIKERVSIRTFCRNTNITLSRSANTTLMNAVTHACNLSDAVTIYKQDGLFQYPATILDQTLNTLVEFGILYRVPDVKSSIDRILTNKDLETVSPHTTTPKGNLFNGSAVTKSILNAKCLKLGLLLEHKKNPELKVRPKHSFEGYLFIYDYFKRAYNLDPTLPKKLFGINTPGCQVLLFKKHGAEALRILDDKIAELKAA